MIYLSLVIEKRIILFVLFFPMRNNENIHTACLLSLSLSFTICLFSCQIIFFLDPEENDMNLKNQRCSLMTDYHEKTNKTTAETFIPLSLIPFKNKSSLSQCGIVSYSLSFDELHIYGRTFVSFLLFASMILFMHISLIMSSQSWIVFTRVFAHQIVFRLSCL